jgi:hydrogenase nickel incorporation protein HypA/HybF
MHEFSICQQMVATVLAELARFGKPNSRLLKTHVVVGRLHAIVGQNLKTAYQVLTRKTAAAGSRLMLKTVPVTAKCRDCGCRTRIKDSLFICGRCGSVKLDIVKGKELYVAKLEVDYDGQDGD